MRAAYVDISIGMLEKLLELPDGAKVLDVDACEDGRQFRVLIHDPALPEVGNDPPLLVPLLHLRQIEWDWNLDAAGYER